MKQCITLCFLVASPIPLSAQQTGQPPLEVAVGIEIDQITGIDQKAENFGAVLSIRMAWNDPKLAFERQAADPDYRLYSVDDFLTRTSEVGTVAPFFIYQNQQGQRWEQEAFVTVYDNGTLEFMERSTLTLQAPYFDFAKFPFDEQRFLVEIVSVYPTERVVYVPMETQSGLGDLLGEEEWILENASIAVTSAKGLTGRQSSKIELEFNGRRHIQYYALRLFLPMLVLIAVSWVSFFLEDYRKRIDIAGANLLVFVAFNFTISDTLPKLGYLTFLDFILQWIFLVTGAVIVINVILRRLQLADKEGLARKIDNYLIKWVFPLGYAGVVLFAVYTFLL